MPLRRPLTVTALLATAVLSLTSCYATAASEPEPSSSASASTGAPVPAPAAPAGAAASSAPAADCTAAAQRPGHEVIKVSAVTAARVTATATTYVCGPDVPNDGYYRASPSAADHPFSAGVTAELVSTGGSGGVSTAAVPLATLTSHVNDCAAQRPVAEPYGCFGGFYDVTVDGSGAITKISEVYHP